MVFKNLVDEKKPEVIIRLLEDALKENYSMEISKSDLNQFKPFPSLNFVSSKFSLNEKQKVAFTIAGNALLSTFKRQLEISANPEKDDSSEDQEEPLRMFLGGEGGTGKSQVIKALKYLSKCWGRPNAVQTVAPTGKAAVSINGETVHSFLKLLNKNFKVSSLTEEEKEKYRELVLLIFDEVGMIGKYEFAKSIKMISTLVGTAKRESCRVHILFSGDLFQLPPVKSNYIFEPSKILSHRKRKQYELSGFEQWHAIQQVIILDENMRQKHDATYAEILSRFRQGISTQRDMEVLNSRYFENSESAVKKIRTELRLLQDKNSNFFPFCVHDNKSRIQIVWDFVYSFSKQSKRKVILCMAEFKRKKKKLDKEDLTNLKELYNAPDNKLDRFSPIFPVIQGLGVSITQNYSIGLGIANGTSGKIVGADFPSGSEFQRIDDLEIDCYVSFNLPSAVFVQIDGAKRKFDWSDTNFKFSNNVFPICPMNKSVRVELPNRRFSVSITQIPLSVSVAATVYKLQGDTVKAIILPSPRGKGETKASMYVMLSRITSLSGLFLLKKFCTNDLQYFKPHVKLITESRRLEKLSEMTLSEYEEVLSERKSSENIPLYVRML